MSNAAKRGRPSKRDVNALNDEESASDQPTEKSVKREGESVPSAQILHLQQERKKEKSELELENDALKAEIAKLRKEKAELQASPPRSMEKDEAMAVTAADDLNSGIIRFEVNEVSTIGEYDEGRYSPMIEVCGVPWRARVSQNEGLSVWLECMIKPSTYWRMDVNADFMLINSDSSKNLTSTEEWDLSHQLGCLGASFYDDWEDFMDEEKGFIRDDTITIEIHFSISNMIGIKIIPRIDFTDPNEPRHDVALIIEGEKIYASKQYLSLHSPFFHALFYGNFTEKNKKEIELKDVNREEFVEMLNTMYPSYRKITTDSIEYLLKLGDRFRVASVVEFVEKCIKYDDLYLRELPEIADRYGLTINSSKDIQADMIKCVPPNEPVDFTDANEPRHDTTLVIGGEKVYVSKQFLSLHSPFFNNLFYEEFKNDTEIELKDINRQEFIEMLHVAYPSGGKITDASAMYLLKLGIIFQVPYVIDRAEEYLISSKTISVFEKFRIADQYGLVGLLIRGLLSLQNFQQFKDVERSPVFDTLSKNTTAAIFRRLLVLL